MWWWFSWEGRGGVWALEWSGVEWSGMGCVSGWDGGGSVRADDGGMRLYRRGVEWSGVCLVCDGWTGLVELSRMFTDAN